MTKVLTRGSPLFGHLVDVMEVSLDTPYRLRELEGRLEGIRSYLPSHDMKGLRAREMQRLLLDALALTVRLAFQFEDAIDKLVADYDTEPQSPLT